MLVINEETTISPEISTPDLLASLPFTNLTEDTLTSENLSGVHDRMTQEELLRMVKKRIAEIDAISHGAEGSTDTLQSLKPGFHKENQVSEDPLSPISKEAIIDKFIQDEPKISKPKAAFFNPSESAVRSNFDDEEIVSETLAKLYASQGNISKAVHIFQKLSLLNQEKSRYFAAQIENLKS